MKTKEEIRSLLLEFVKNSEYHQPLHDRYTEITILDGKIYFPSFVYHGCDAKPDKIDLQSYGSTSYTALYPIEKVDAYLKANGVEIPTAKKGDDVYCKCGNKSFTFSYGGYSLEVKCNSPYCGNEWTAYSG